MDPLSPFLQWRLGHKYHLTRQWDRAIEQCRNALELDPHYVAAHFGLGQAFIRTGKVDEAIRALETMLQLSGHSPMALGFLGYAYAHAGRIREARKLLEEIQELAHKAYVPPSSYAWICFGLGEINTGFEWLEKAVDEREGYVIHFHVEPTYDPLRAHPRYQGLLRKMNLEP